MALLTATGIPETVLNRDQNEALAGALTRFSRHFPSIKMPAKYMDGLALLGCVAIIGKTQFDAYKHRTAMERAQSDQASMQTNFSFAGAQ